MIIHRRVYLMGSLYLIALGGFLAGLAFFQYFPQGSAPAGSGLLALAGLSFVGAIISLTRALKD
jgi:hypothetical protein